MWFWGLTEQHAPRRLVCCINDSGIQLRLPDLTFKKAFDLAQVERNVQDLQSPKVSLEKLYLVKGISERSQAPVCYRCGGCHRGADSRYKDVTIVGSKDTYPKSVGANRSVAKILELYSPLFHDELGCVADIRVNFVLIQMRLQSFFA